MRAQAQGLSSAANSDGSAVRGSVFGRRNDATRASSSCSNGSSASSHRRSRLALGVFAAFFALLAFASAASASKEVRSYFGAASGSGSLGGEFFTPRDSAVNNTGTGAPRGTIYVADDDNNRIQRFDRDGRFVSAWGADVIQAGRPGDQAGTNPFEICTVAADCKAGVATGGNTAMSGNGALDNPKSVAVDGDTGYVYVSDRDNRRVNAYDASGNFLFSVGKDVADPDGGVAVEICVGGVDVCRQGDAGSGVGEIGSAGTDSLGIAVSHPDSNAASGKIYLADSANRRVNVYDLDGRNPTSFGAAGAGARAFGSSQPTRVAVDSAGIVYASNSNVNGEIERYDTVGAAFLDPISARVPGTNETQRITFVGFSTGDTFTLTCPDGRATNPISYATNLTGKDTIVNSLLAACGGNSFSGNGNPPNTTITFQDFYGATNVPTMVCATVSGSGTCSITQEVDGTPDSTSEALLAGSTAGLAASATGALYVLRDRSSGTTAVQQFNSPGAVSPPSADDDKHGAGAGFSTVGGLGLDGNSGRLLVSATTDVSGIGAADRVYVLDTLLPAPVVALDPVTAATSTTATFSGTVDPRGGLVTGCKFQYSVDQVIWNDVVELGCASMTPGGGAQEVRENVTGLRPATHYFVRFQATRLFVPSSVATTSLRVFDTDTSLPVVGNVGAVDVQDTSARMVTTIDTRNSATGYVFEYGTTPSLGSSTAPIDIGAGSAPTTVSQVVRGLAPDTAYYMRAVATNLAGSTNSSSATFHTRTDPLPLPDNRGYEQVSPVDKNGGDGFFESSNKIRNDLFAAADGSAVAYTAPSSFGENPPEKIHAAGLYFSRRTPNGWSLGTGVRPPFCLQGQLLIAISLPQAFFFSRDLRHALLQQPEGQAECPIPPLLPNAPVDEQGNNLYRSDLGDSPTYELLNPQLGISNSIGSALHNDGTLNGSYRGASDDQSHVVFSSRGPQTADSPPFTGPRFQRLYLWQQLGTPGCTNLSPSYDPIINACIALISKDTTGTAFTTDSNIPGYASGANDYAVGNQDAINAVSETGDRVFFENQGELYLHEGGTTYHVSQSECTASCGADAAAAFRFASPSGAAALFVSAERLTDSDTSSSGVDLFRYAHSADPATNPSNLADLSIDNEPLDGTAADVLGVVGASDDLETVFFVANGQLVSGATTAAGPKLYRWRWNGGAPSLEYLATLASGDEDENWVDGADDPRRERRVTPDGETLVLESGAQLDPIADQDTDVDVYRWREEGGFRCVSCQLPGEPSGGASNTGSVGRIVSPVIVSKEMSSAFTDDGERIFFQTQDALVSGDTNGPCGRPLSFYPCTDVYEWHDGAVSLITPGDSADDTDVQLTGATPSGQDVYFATRQPLVGWDEDDKLDVYDARVGGGFPEPPATDLCEGEACRGGGSSSGTIPGAGSRVLVHAGNQKSANPCAPISNKLKRKLAAAKKAARKGQARRARALRKQARNLKRRAKRCNRRQAR